MAPCCVRISVHALYSVLNFLINCKQIWQSSEVSKHTGKRTVWVEGRKLIYTSSEGPSAPLTRHQRSHLCTTSLVFSVYCHSFLLNCFKNAPLCTHLLVSRYWPAIDNALRRAAFNYRVQIRLLVSCWTHSDPAMLYYLRSLRALNNPHAHISVDVVR